MSEAEERCIHPTCLMVLIYPDEIETGECRMCREEGPPETDEWREEIEEVAA